MKKTLKTILFAFLCGAILSGFTLYSLQEKFSFQGDKNTVTAFQIGVYKSKENAENIKNQYPGSIAVQDGEYYRVYVGVAKDKKWEELLENYFTGQNINVYPKMIEVTSDFYKQINIYESNIEKEDMAIYSKINQEILKKLEGEIL